MNDFVAKPVKPADLEACLSRVPAAGPSPRRPGGGVGCAYRSVIPGQP